LPSEILTLTREAVSHRHRKPPLRAKRPRPDIGGLPGCRGMADGPCAAMSVDASPLLWKTLLRPHCLFTEAPSATPHSFPSGPFTAPHTAWCPWRHQAQCGLNWWQERQDGQKALWCVVCNGPGRLAARREQIWDQDTQEPYLCL
jgi:hypothetical protein